MLKRNDTVLWRELDGEAVLLDSRAGCSYNLNQVGTLIWKLLDGTHSVAEIVAAICASYEVEAEQAAQDVEQLLEELEKHNLLVKASSAIHPSA
ncbi:MAG TPA: PqqD family protein [Ktedonobacteraceae bacterium]|nr:PqqD family protein [Ktedonobacteraceae bacterium]